MFFYTSFRFITLGDLVGLQQALLQMEALDMKENMSTEITASQKVQELQNNAQVSYDKKDFRKVVFLMDRCLDVCPASDRYSFHLDFVHWVGLNWW